MKTLLTIALAATALAGATAAEARDGCGPGGHRDFRGFCRPNLYGPGPGVIVAPGVIVGGFYPGRGYWYGNRYWGHRYWYGGGWRYR